MYMYVELLCVEGEPGNKAMLGKGSCMGYTVHVHVHVHVQCIYMYVQYMYTCRSWRLFAGPFLDMVAVH